MQVFLRRFYTIELKGIWDSNPKSIIQNNVQEQSIEHKKRENRRTQNRRILYSEKNSNAEDILSTERKITEGTDEWKKVSMYYEEQVDIIRNKNKGVHALGQNVSYTELNINGSKNSIQATRGLKQIDGFADLVGNKYNTIDSQRFFETKFVDNNNVISENGWNRSVDTESKTLEQIVRDLGSVKNADGTVT